MSVYAYEAQESWLPTVTGLTCSAIHQEDVLLQVHFGALRHDDSGIADADRTISLYGVWRVEQYDTIIAGSGDLDDLAADSLDLLKGATLERFEVRHPGFDLDLYFSGGIAVRCFPCDSQEFADHMEEETDFPISWWVDGIGVSDDWEEPYDPQGV